MSKEKYFGGGNCGEFMWGKGLDSPKEKRSKVWHDSDTPRFAEGGPVIPGSDMPGSAALKKGGKVKGRFADGGSVRKKEMSDVDKAERYLQDYKKENRKSGAMELGKDKHGAIGRGKQGNFVLLSNGGSSKCSGKR